MSDLYLTWCATHELPTEYHTDKRCMIVWLGDIRQDMPPRPCDLTHYREVSTSLLSEDHHTMQRVLVPVSLEEA